VRKPFVVSSNRLAWAMDCSFDAAQRNFLQFKLLAKLLVVESLFVKRCMQRD